jgi:two-component system nitrate/nitrite sensor histidine kinase NarX
VQITREALTNTVKHAQATEITIRLRYPLPPDDMAQLTISDNGRTGQVVTVKPGHWGVPNMYESACAVSGALELNREVHGGTVVVFTFAPACS